MKILLSSMLRNGVSPESKSDKEPFSHSGFTLIELLVVIAIIAILAGLIAGTVGYIQNKGGTARAESEIAALATALEGYKADNGDYPGNVTDDPSLTSSPTDNTNLLVALMPATGKVYFEFPKGMLNITKDSSSNFYTNIIDPFGEKYGYRYPAKINGTNLYDLWSRVGTTNTNVWIKNW